MTFSERVPLEREEDLEGSASNGFETLFVIGCPRSGTTWIQLLLDQHPAIVTAPETQIFSFYLDHFRKQWLRERTGPAAQEQGGAGLSRLLSEREFDDLCRLNAEWVLRKIAAANPPARFVVEKSPLHAVHASWIHRILPRAWFLHVVRDPRDTVASIMAAGRSWGRGWAPKGPVEAARMWRRNVEGALEIVGETPRFLEVTYEALKNDTPGELERIVTWLGVRSDAADCAAAAERCRIERLREAPDGSGLPTPGRSSPKGFFRRGVVGGWRSELGRSDVAAVERVCGSVMERYGYERATRGTFPSHKVVVHDVLQRLRESLDWQLEKFIGRL